MERALLRLNSYHTHGGICIEGTSMHLHCLYDQRKAVSSSRKGGKTGFNRWMTLTLRHTLTHTRPQRKTKSSHTHTHTHSAIHRFHLICMMLKLRTVQHTNGSTISRDGEHQEEEKHFKEHLLRGSIHQSETGNSSEKFSS